MIKVQIIIVVFLTFLSLVVYGQTIGDEKLNQYYSEGENSFARHILSTIKYPQEARKEGTMGLAIFSFRVDCQGSPTDFTFENKLGNGIEEEIERIITTTQGNWIECETRNQSDRIKLNFAFSINDYYDSPDADLVIVAYGSFPVIKDTKLKKQYNKALKKGEFANAKKAIEELIKRYPENSVYLKQREEVESLIRN
ncbi:hypothetical protein [Catalinimonas niigatensis]|uniref:hypothetical protein n=1 Tax=Catalinimonas niigatensis TaxID=1397264 RepID=UPI002666E751|nr:hypothetical protein [Catalinimonas niigatensis]WPP49432.1 hypothetical protein PZB72_22430 [Catalinimonas niigatensis]